MNNITTGGDVFDYNAVSWTALGAGSQNGFSGTFNGNGHKIYVPAQIGRKSIERQDLAKTKRQHAKKNAGKIFIKAAGVLLQYPCGKLVII